MGKRTSGGANSTCIKISSPRAVRTQVRTTQNVILCANETGCLTQTTSHTPTIEDLPELIDLNLDDDDVLDHDNITTPVDVNPEDGASSTWDNDIEKKKQVSTSMLDQCRALYLSVLQPARPVQDWAKHRKEYLDEFLRHDGLGDLNDNENPICVHCKINPGNIRCQDCFGGHLACRQCVVEVHQWLPLHRLQVSHSQLFYKLHCSFTL